MTDKQIYDKLRYRRLKKRPAPRCSAIGYKGQCHKATRHPSGQCHYHREEKDNSL